MHALEGRSVGRRCTGEGSSSKSPSKQGDGAYAEHRNAKLAPPTRKSGNVVITDGWPWRFYLFSRGRALQHRPILLYASRRKTSIRHLHQSRSLRIRHL